MGDPSCPATPPPRNKGALNHTPAHANPSSLHILPLRWPHLPASAPGPPTPAQDRQSVSEGRPGSTPGPLRPRRPPTPPPLRTSLPQAHGYEHVGAIRAPEPPAHTHPREGGWAAPPLPGPRVQTETQTTLLAAGRPAPGARDQGPSCLPSPPRSLSFGVEGSPNAPPHPQDVALLGSGVFAEVPSSAERGGGGWALTQRLVVL